MIYLFSGLLSGGILTAICWPLFAKNDSLESTILEETQWDLLQRKKDVILGNIQDLDFEYKCGKLSEEDCKLSREEMAAEVAIVLDRIDRIESSQDLDALIRTEVGARKKRVADSRVCSNCGQRNSPQNKFCADCGTNLD
jgi:ribosomal protein L40E